MDVKIGRLSEIAPAGNSNKGQTVELAIVIPTYNERDNMSSLLERLETVLDGVSWEAIFVDDDSSDGTADVLRDVAQRNQRVRVILRIHRRGLSSACVEGILSSSAPFFAVIDADMQHDELILPRMFEQLKQENLDIVVGSRYTEGGSVAGWNKRRRIISRLASWAARPVLKVDLRDPMSGFFLMRRRAFDELVRNLSQEGFKILLDIFASAPRPLRFVELPYAFRQREHGESKLDSLVAWEYGMLLADKLFGRFLPPRFLLFGVIGGFGLLVHVAMLAIALERGFSFTVSQTIAVIAAMTSNFTLNNLVTYRDRRLKGLDFVRGLLSFYTICSIGAVANVHIAAIIYAGEPIWWFAGLAGAIVSAVWNYGASAFFTWRRR